MSAVTFSPTESVAVPAAGPAAAPPVPEAAARAAPLPPNEGARLAALRSAQILDTLPERMFDDIVQVASAVCGTPIALVSLVDSHRQWFKARLGLQAEQTPREQAFCAHAILEPQQPLVVPDATQDPRFADNPLVTGSPDIRMYAGAPIVSASGHALGTVCVIDRQPRELNPMQLQCLQALSRQAANLLEYRRISRNSVDAAQLQLLEKSDRLRALQQAHAEKERALNATIERLEQELAQLRAPRSGGEGDLSP